MTVASAHMESAVSATDAFDVVGAASFIRLAADEVEASAFAMEADPAISEPLLAAAGHYRLAAGQADAFQIVASTRSLEEGAAEIGVATRAVNATTVPIC
jgi:hypothetical protein